MFGDPRLSARFWNNVAVDPETGCWNWTGYIYKRRGGYGRYKEDKKSKRAHRVAYERLVGPMPEGLETDHVCRNKRCVNPDHLEAVTRQENMRRRFSVMTHCPNGHQYVEDNTRRGSDGKRHCRVCSARRLREWKARQRNLQHEEHA